MLGPEERELIRRSFDLRTSRRRQVVSLATSVALALVVVAVAIPLRWPLPLVLAFLAYIALAAYERWVYGRSVVLYKSVIAKLWSHIERHQPPGPP